MDECDSGPNELIRMPVDSVTRADSPLVEIQGERKDRCKHELCEGRQDREDRDNE